MAKGKDAEPPPPEVQEKPAIVVNSVLAFFAGAGVTAAILAVLSNLQPIAALLHFG